MNNDLNYNEAFASLQVLVRELEEADLPLDLLPGKIEEAAALIAICDARLRTIVSAATESLSPLTSTPE